MLAGHFGPAERLSRGSLWRRVDAATSYWRVVTRTRAGLEGRRNFFGEPGSRTSCRTAEVGTPSWRHAVAMASVTVSPSAVTTLGAGLVEGCGAAGGVGALRVAGARGGAVAAGREPTDG